MGVNSFVIEGMKLKNMCKSMSDCVNNCPFYDHNAKNPFLDDDKNGGYCMFAAIGMNEPHGWDFYFEKEDSNERT
jgi:hypothetical protein